MFVKIFILAQPYHFGLSRCSLQTGFLKPTKVKAFLSLLQSFCGPVKSRVGTDFIYGSFNTVKRFHFRSDSPQSLLVDFKSTQATRMLCTSSSVLHLLHLQRSPLSTFLQALYKSWTTWMKNPKACRHYACLALVTIKTFTPIALFPIIFLDLGAKLFLTVFSD